MTVINKHPTHKDVTYIGKEDPFVDRNYGSQLDFVPGQSRSIPVALAARFLLHADCFEESKGDTDAAAEAASLADKAEKTKEKDAKALKKAKEQEDTDAKLALQKKEEDERREKENKIFDLHTQIDNMKKADVIEFMSQHFKEPVNEKLLVADLKAQAKSLVDKFGVA